MSYFVREVNIIYAPLLFGLSISKLQVGLLSWYNHNLEFMFQPNDSYISWGMGMEKSNITNMDNAMIQKNRIHLVSVRVDWN